MSEKGLALSSSFLLLFVDADIGRKSLVLLLPRYHCFVLWSVVCLNGGTFCYIRLCFSFQVL